MNRLLLCGALAALVIAVSIAFQRPITYNDGLGWDGAQYAQLASQCGRRRLEAFEPFVYRIGMPCLAALVPAPPRFGLLVVNAAAAVLLLFLCDAWLRRHLSRTIATVVLVGFAFHWVAPLRQVWWYPTYIDPGALSAMLGALLVSPRGDKPSSIFFVLICFAGALIRETTIIVPISMIFGARVGRALDLRAVVAGTVASLAGIALTHLVASPTSDYWIADAAFFWAYSKPLPEYLLAIFITYGPALSLLAIGWPAVKAHLAKFPDQAMLLLIVLMLAWIGGSDTERFLMWGFPVVLVLIGKAAEQVTWAHAKGAAALLLAAQAISGRWLLPIPSDFVEDPARVWPILTPFTASSYLQLYAQMPDRLMGAVALAEYLALTTVLALWFVRKGSRSGRAHVPP